MTGDQFLGALLFIFPAFILISSFQVFPCLFGCGIIIFVMGIGEKAFIENVKDGYVEIEDSIFPNWFYGDKE